MASRRLLPQGAGPRVLRDPPAPAAQHLLGHDARTFVQSPDGQTTLPVWVDHMGSAGTRYATGILRRAPLAEPTRSELPRISDAAWVRPFPRATTCPMPTRCPSA